MKSMFNLSKHSMERMKSRSISYEDVQQVITRGVRSHSGCDDCYKCDYSGLRAVVTQENILVTVFRIAGEDQFVKKDSRHARALYRRRKSALRERISSKRCGRRYDFQLKTRVSPANFD